MAEAAHDLGGALGLGGATDPERDRAGALIGGREERHVLDVDAGTREGEGDLGGRAGTVLDRDAQLQQRRRREIGLEQEPAILAGGDLPGGECLGVARADQLGGPLEPLDDAVDLGCHGLGVGAVDVGPDPRVGTGDARCVAEAATDLGRAVGAAVVARRRGDEDVGEDVRKVADRGHLAVVRSRVDGLGPGAEAGDEAMEAVEHDPLRVTGRGQVPTGAVEEVGPRALDPGRLGAGQRVAADEALEAGDPGDGIEQAPLGRADVGDDRVGAGGGDGPTEEPWQSRDRRGAEDRLRPLDGVVDRFGDPVERAQLERLGEGRRVLVEPDDLSAESLLGGEADRAADQPDAEDGDPHRAPVAQRDRAGRGPPPPGDRGPRPCSPSPCRHR